MRATAKRDLRTGRSLWVDSPGLGVSVRPLKATVSVDVAIVGAGISGAFMAHELARDHSVVVLDRRPPLMGSTIASTAMLQWEIDLPLTALADKIGKARARRAYARSRAAVDDLKRIVAEEGIRCALLDEASLYLAGDEYGRRALEAEAEARAAMGLDSVFVGPADLRNASGSTGPARSCRRIRSALTRPSWRRACCAARSRMAPLFIRRSRSYRPSATPTA